MVPDEEQQGGVTRGVRQRDVLGGPGDVPDGGVGGVGNGLRAHFGRRLDAVDGTAEGARQGGRHAAGSRAQVEPDQRPRRRKAASEGLHPGLEGIG
jgi:hypothetical protein